MYSFKLIQPKVIQLSLTSGGYHPNTATPSELFNIRDTLINTPHFTYNTDSDTFITDLHSKDILKVIQQISSKDDSRGKLYVCIQPKIIQMNWIWCIANYLNIVLINKAFNETLISGVYTTIISDVQINDIICGSKLPHALSSISYENFGFTHTIHVDKSI